MRLQHPLSDDTMEAINKQFGSLLLQGGAFMHYQGKDYAPDEEEFPDLYRLVFHFNMKRFGSLQRLIEFINDQTTPSKKKGK